MRATVTVNNILDGREPETERLVNIKLGTLDPLGMTPVRTSQALTIASPAWATSGIPGEESSFVGGAGSPFAISIPQTGLEFSGMYGRSIRYAVGIVNGGGTPYDQDKKKDLYFSISYKVIGGDYGFDPHPGAFWERRAKAQADPGGAAGGGGTPSGEKDKTEEPEEEDPFDFGAFDEPEDGDAADGKPDDASSSSDSSSSAEASTPAAADAPPAGLPGYLLDDSLEIGVAAYSGKDRIPHPNAPTQLNEPDDYDYVIGFARIHYGSLDLTLVGMEGKHSDPYGPLSSQAGGIRAASAELIWYALPVLAITLRYEQILIDYPTDWGGLDPATPPNGNRVSWLVSASFLMRANLKFVAEYEHFTGAAASRLGDSETRLLFDMAF